MSKQKINVKPQGDMLRVRVMRDRVPEKDMLLDMLPAEEMALQVLEEVANWRKRQVAGI